MNNAKLYVDYYNSHQLEGGKMPIETALTLVVRDCLKTKKYKVFGQDVIDLWDVVMYFNMAGDVFFGVCTEKDSNVIYVKSGTSTGVITKKLEG